MAIQTLRNAPALDNTLQSTNGLLGTQNGKLDSIVTAIMSISLASVGNISALTTTDKTSLVGAANELNAGKVSTSSVGVAGGVAELDNTGKVPASQLPAFVDDVIEGYLYNGNFYEDSAHTQLITPEDGKIYIDLVSNKTYRWSGSQYTVISDTLALGETSTTAYRGDRGKTAYDHSQDANRVTTAKAEGLYKIGATAQGHISSATAVTKGDITALGLVGSVTDSTTNGNILVDDSEVQVYDDTDVTNDITDINGKLSTATTSSTGNPISFTTKSAQNAVSTIIDLEPIQDLHGYDKPWVGGAGKNKLPLTVDGIKSANPSATWNGNTTVINNVTFTILTDSDGNVTGINANGTANGSTSLRLMTFNVPANSYIVNGAPSDGSSTTYRQLVYNQTTTSYIAYDNGSGASFTLNADSQITILINVANGVQVTNKVFYPMIRLSTETDPTFAPYTNLCPISGRTEIGIEGCGKNIIDSLEQGIYATDASTTASTTRVKSKIFKLTSGTYSISFSTSLSKTVNLIYTLWKNGTYGTNENIEQSTWLNTNPYTLTLTQDSYVSFTFRFSDNSTITSSDIDVQVEKGSATTYEPYTPSNDITIQFGETVYGGSLDVEKGELVVDKARQKISDLTWTSATGNYAKFTTNSLVGVIKGSDTEKVVISELYKSEDNTTVPANQNHIYANSGGQVKIWDDAYASSDTSGWLTARGDSYICYELATPITIQLTPHVISLLKGVNNISVSDDYSTITLTYRSGEVATLGDLLETEDKMLAKQHVYSTDEQIVGTWIDGKPIYEKTYIFSSAITLASNTFTELVDTDNTGMETGISAKAINDIGVCYGFVAVIVNDSSGHLMVLQTRDSNIIMKYLILQYTKST